VQILLLSFQFSSLSAFASNRTMKLAKFLLSRGHDVRILTADNDFEAPLGFDRNRVLSAPVPARSGFGSAVWDSVMFTGSRNDDPSANWRRPALEAAKTMFASWKPDILYAVCPPHSTAVLAGQIAQATEVPFITDFSERWGFGSDVAVSPRRRSAAIQKERAVLSRAAGIVTSSPEWADSYARLFGASKAVLAMNGFDPDDYPLSSPVESDADRNVLKVLMTNEFRPGRSDPRILFKSLAALGEGSKNIRITMVGDHADSAFAIAKEERIHKQVDFHPPETREEIIERQFAADALAMTLAPNTHDDGGVASELFDCIGARRPVIGCGWGKSINAGIIRNRNLGIVSNEPKVIANALARLLAKKRAVGVVPALPRDVRRNAAMAAQFSGLESLLFDAVSGDFLAMAAE